MEIDSPVCRVTLSVLPLFLFTPRSEGLLDGSPYCNSGNEYRGIHTPTTFSTVNSSTSKSHTLCDTFLLGILWVQSRRPTLVVVPLSRTRVSVPIQGKITGVSALTLNTFFVVERGTNQPHRVSGRQ